jgi:hypothetical protein
MTVSPGNIQHRACRQRFTGGEPAVPAPPRLPDEVRLAELETAANQVLRAVAARRAARLN